MSPMPDLSDEPISIARNGGNLRDDGPLDAFAALRRAGAFAGLAAADLVIDGIWGWDLARREIFQISDAFWQCLGVDAASRTGRIGEWRDLVRAGDRERLTARLDAFLTGGEGVFDETLTCGAASGLAVTVRMRGVVVRREARECMFGTLTILSDPCADPHAPRRGSGAAPAMAGVAPASGRGRSGCRGHA